MSCFKGLMKEYKKISIDRFDGINLKSTVYMLSHCHEDHMVGLDKPEFLERLHSSTDVFLYCSEVTKVLLEANRKYRHLKQFIRTKPIDEPSTLVIPNPATSQNDEVQLTLLPAYHCPGSVMFLLEGREGTVLYTGDFRWENFDLDKMASLRSGNSTKQIKSLYVDTTFFSENSLFIPSRQNCIDAVYCLVRDWIGESPNNIVHISPRSQYGHEPLLKAVAEKLGFKVHVAPYKFEVYEKIQELRDYFTTDESKTPIHACGKQVCRFSMADKRVMLILPTTMFFTHRVSLGLSDIIVQTHGCFRACYSFHSSFTEIRQLLAYLKPTRVFPNVKPMQDDSLDDTASTLAKRCGLTLYMPFTSTGFQDVQQRLNNLLVQLTGPKEHGEGNHIHRELGLLKRRSLSVSRKHRESLSDSESLDFGSPKKVRRRSWTPPLTTMEKSFANRLSNSEEKGSASEKAISPGKSSQSGTSYSSYYRSDNSGSELDLLSSQENQLSSQLDMDRVAREFELQPGSFLEEIKAKSSQELQTGTQSFCVMVLDDDEQVDENFENTSHVEENDTTRRESEESDQDVNTKENSCSGTRKTFEFMGKENHSLETNGTMKDSCIKKSGENIHNNISEKADSASDLEIEVLEDGNNDSSSIQHSNRDHSINVSREDIRKETIQEQNNKVSPHEEKTQIVMIDNDSEYGDAKTVHSVNSNSGINSKYGFQILNEKRKRTEDDVGGKTGNRTNEKCSKNAKFTRQGSFDLFEDEELDEERGANFAQGAVEEKSGVHIDEEVLGNRTSVISQKNKDVIEISDDDDEDYDNDDDSSTYEEMSDSEEEKILRNETITHTVINKRVTAKSRKEMLIEKMFNEDTDSTQSPSSLSADSEDCVILSGEEDEISSSKKNVNCYNGFDIGDEDGHMIRKHSVKNFIDKITKQIQNRNASNSVNFDPDAPGRSGYQRFDIHSPHMSLQTSHRMGSDNEGQGHGVIDLTQSDEEDGEDMDNAAAADGNKTLNSYDVIEEIQ